ncbi:hypothetical protein [Burkholderia gladioli]|uniref:hypothetical protein n=1 Tax=Burkholderia gladioli TaxID=28095 RepID=UPI0016414D7B|nr:hypothetical protein [Burkholderia gladioli]
MLFSAVTVERCWVIWRQRRAILQTRDNQFNEGMSAYAAGHDQFAMVLRLPDNYQHHFK